MLKHVEWMYFGIELCLETKLPYLTFTMLASIPAAAASSAETGAGPASPNTRVCRAHDGVVCIDFKFRLEKRKMTLKQGCKFPWAIHKLTENTISSPL